MAGTSTSVIAPPPFLFDTEQWKRLCVPWMRNAHQGHLANVGRVTFTSGTVETVLTDSRIGANCFIGLSPTTANAAAETPYIGSQSKGAATITHANAATGDRTFIYCILG